MTKKKNIAFVIGLIIFCILAICFYFFDLEISKNMASDNPNFIFILLAAIGEFPIYIGPILFGLVYGFTSESKNAKLISHFVGIIGMYIAFIRLTNGIFNEFFSSSIWILQYILLAIVALIVYILMFMAFNKIDSEKLYKMRDIALIYFIVSLSSFLIVTLMKNIWGRPRYRILDNNYEAYSNFLTISGFKNSKLGDNYRSFPSGHTNAASSILVLSLITPRFTNKKWVKYLITGICIVYPVLVAISRICVGAHYASDVLFGFGVSFTCLLTTYIIFKKKGWLYVRSNKC